MDLLHGARFIGFGYPRYFMAWDFCACPEISCERSR